MESTPGVTAIVGVFESRDAALAAATRLRAVVPEERVNVLMPGPRSSDEVEGVPTTEAEPPGMGATLGGVVGGALGLSAGVGAAAFLFPGVGQVTAIGLAAVALFGLGGAGAGAVVGDAVEGSLDQGLPRDELLVYEDALRQGRSVVVVNAGPGDEAAQVRELFANVGAESVDAARERWWLGLREEERQYHGDDFDAAEADYRRGFEAALRMGALEDQGRSRDTAADEPEVVVGDPRRAAAFRRGFERGEAYLAAWRTRRDVPRGDSVAPPPTH